MCFTTPLKATEFIPNAQSADSCFATNLQSVNPNTAGSQTAPARSGQKPNKSSIKPPLKKTKSPRPPSPPEGTSSKSEPSNDTKQPVPVSLDMDSIGTNQARKIMSEEHKLLGFRPPADSLAARAQAAATQHPDLKDVSPPPVDKLKSAAKADAERILSERKNSISPERKRPKNLKASPHIPPVRTEGQRREVLVGTDTVYSIPLQPVQQSSITRRRPSHSQQRNRRSSFAAPASSKPSRKSRTLSRGPKSHNGNNQSKNGDSKSKRALSAGPPKHTKTQNPNPNFRRRKSSPSKPKPQITSPPTPLSPHMNRESVTMDKADPPRPSRPQKTKKVSSPSSSPFSSASNTRRRSLRRLQPAISRSETSDSIEIICNILA
ncbi:hypothetical protein K474DRAFT_1661399 [Panus rudis PR-1116 ss-1]|nr:hypothetical protein K474DRAFT_1661399 [Panus rudis PR-1116 ss-1]